MLGMAVDLHDHLICPCGCGQWEKDARDPLLKDRWRVIEEVCYVRRTLDAHTKEHEPAPDVQLSVRLDRTGDAATSDYEDIRARFPERFTPQT